MEPSAKRQKTIRFSEYEDRMIRVLEKHKSPLMGAGGDGRGYGSYSSGGPTEARRNFQYYLQHYRTGLKETENFLKYYDEQR